MKKLLICLALAFSLVTLGACGKNESAKPTSSTNNHQSKGQGQVTLILKTVLLNCGGLQRFVPLNLKMNANLKK